MAERDINTETFFNAESVDPDAKTITSMEGRNSTTTCWPRSRHTAASTWSTRQGWAIVAGSTWINTP